MSAAGIEAADDAPRIAGIPASHWAYAVRIWVAMLVALYAGFWLQLDGAGEAAVTVTILSQPMRGQVLSKSFYRALGTFAGFLACIAITGLFPQSRDLYILAYSLWIAACVYAGSLSEGTRAYAFVLSGYTVAIVVVANTDHPQAVFDAAVSRVALVLLGIASVALVNDVLAAPNVYPRLRDRLRSALEGTGAAVADLLRGDRAPGREAAVADRVVGARLDILALPVERAAGARRAGAARSAAAAMVEALAAARMAARATALVRSGDGRADAAGGDRDRAMLSRFRADAEAGLRLAERECAAMEAGDAPSRRAHLPHHRSREEALRKAARVFFAVAGSSIVLIYGDWPDAAQALTQVIVLGCLGMTVPDDRAFAKVCLMAMPLAALIGGATKFLLLDGGDGFPMLALGIAPGIFLCCLMFCRAKTSELGFLTLIYVAVFIEPANPQRFDPQEFIQLALLYNLGVVLLAVSLAVFIPTTDRDRRRWLLRRFERELRAALAGDLEDTPAEVAYRGADRLARLAKLEIGSAEANERRLARAALLSDATVAAARAHAALSHPGWAGAAHEVAAAREVLKTFSAEGLDRAAEAVAAAPLLPAETRARASRAAADLRFLALLAAAPPPALRRAVRGLPAGAPAP